MKQLLTYFTLAYIISWVIWLPLYGHIFGWEQLPAVPYNHALGGLGPMIAAFTTTYIYDGNTGITRLLGKCFKFRPLVYLVIALFSPFVLAVIAIFINHFFGSGSLEISGLLKTKEFPKFNLLTFFIYNLVFFGLGEEVGWRGFALPRFQSKSNALVSSFILTLLWAIWHWPLFFYRVGYTSMGFAGTAGWVFSLFTGSILLTWLYNSSRASILICAVFHSTVDIAFTADIADKSIINYMGFLISVWGILTIIIFKPRHLAKNKRIKKIDSDIFYEKV